MALFIPERSAKISGPKLRVKQILKGLDDGHVVRSPINGNDWSPDFFVQHKNGGWLALVVCDIRFQSLAAEQLFSSEEKETFETLLARFAALNGLSERGHQTLPKVMLMWACDEDQCRRISGSYLGHTGIRFYSKSRFSHEIGPKLISRLLDPLDPEDTEVLMGAYFPEAEIHPEQTTRRHFHRDNSARLPKLFLDRYQEWASKLDLEPTEEQEAVAGDMSVRLLNGVAGSGKTLIVLSRARLLAKMYPERSILVLIHNRPIVADIQARMFRAYGRLPKNLEIATFYSWATRQWQALFGTRPDIEQYVDQVEKTIRSRREKWPNLRPSEKQIREELDFINDTLITTQEQYLDANRAGRGFSLKSAERAEVWQLYQDITGHLRRQGKRLWSDVPRDLCLSAKPDRLPLFQHILIDEAQFFAPAWFELVKLSLAPGGDLFLCADPNQGFMKNRLSWKSAGLDVVGRTRKLRKSYRTTRAILAAATHILATRTQGNPDEFLVPDMEGMEEGQPPVLIRAYSPQDAVDRLVNELAAMAGPGLGLDAALVVYGEEISRDLLRGELGRRFGAANVWCFAKHKNYPPGNRLSPYLRMANLGAATGLEASIVFVLGVDALLSGRTPEGAGPEEAAALREEDARKLYMAMTRAGQRLVLIAREELPENIGKFFISE